MEYCAGYLYNHQTKEFYNLTYAHEQPESSARFGDYLVTKCGVLMMSLFVFFTTTMSVSFTLRETQTRMLKFTVQLQHHARHRLPTFQLIFVHVIESLVFVPIMIGILFFLFEFYDDQLLAFMVLIFVWLCELFTLIRCQRPPQKRTSNIASDPGVFFPFGGYFGREVCTLLLSSRPGCDDLGGRCRKGVLEGTQLLPIRGAHCEERFLNSCLVGSFVKWVGSLEAIRNWAAEEWGVIEGVKITQLNDTQFLFRFASEDQAVKILKEGRSCFDNNFMHLERWKEDVGCVDSRSSGDPRIVNLVGLPLARLVFGENLGEKRREGPCFDSGGRWGFGVQSVAVY
ncbi:hypothetical protein HAX54_046549 [Datura stramonium]|uniref:DUF4283 domain-containing protein n=1 Tax=Datura stramonium TaxID=4076 RepID=A0ABS8WJC9_DATST|nr:hypothetical protein [Datura stramonium]